MWYPGALILYSFFLEIFYHLWSFVRKRPFFISKIQIKNIIHQKCWIFYCSSAGEYEQALPLLELIQKNNPEIFLHVFFFSPSGIQYIHHRKDKISYSQAPLDSVWRWSPIFRALKPERIFIVRYEFWPGFLFMAQKYGKIVLMDLSPTKNPSWLKKWWYSYAFKAAHLLCVLDSDSALTLEKVYDIREKKKIKICGDTKYDRAQKRALDSSSKAHQLEKVMNRFVGNSARLIVGSAWPQDMDFIFSSMKFLKRLKPFQIVIVPHSVHSLALLDGEQICQRYGFVSVRYSELESLQEQKLFPPPKISVVFFDRMGALAELYKIGKWAFVGGGLHHRVHNVLEPAFQGVPVAFGPKYTESHEAKELIKAKGASSLASPQALIQWLNSPQSPTISSCEALLSQKIGATQRIWECL